MHEKIKELRTEKNLTQKKLADMVGVSRVAVTQWESEGGTHPSRQNLRSLAEIFGVSVGYLADDDVAQKMDVFEPTHWDEMGDKADDGRAVTVPFLSDTFAAAGAGQESADHPDKIQLPFLRQSLERRGISISDVVVARIRGDSGYPYLWNGDTVAVDRSQRRPRKGQLYLIDEKDVGLRVKYLEKLASGDLLVSSRNAEEYPAETLSILDVMERITIVGRVFWLSRMFD